jgi:formylmethanofuran dehydrogenase subunit E
MKIINKIRCLFKTKIRKFRELDEDLPSNNELEYILVCENCGDSFRYKYSDEDRGRYGINGPIYCFDCFEAKQNEESFK